MCKTGDLVFAESIPIFKPRSHPYFEVISLLAMCPQTLLMICQTTHVDTAFSIIFPLPEIVNSYKFYLPIHLCNFVSWTTLANCISIRPQWLKSCRLVQKSIVCSLFSAITFLVNFLVEKNSWMQRFAIPLGRAPSSGVMEMFGWSIGGSKQKTELRKRVSSQ